MAQVTGDSGYDWDWHYKWNSALRLLRDLASAWGMEQDVAPSQAAAVLIRALAASDLQGIPSPQPLRVRLTGVRSLESELAALCPKASNDDLEEAARALQEIMQGARRAWTKEDDLDPDEQAVLQAIVGLLFERKLFSRPPKK